MADFDNDTYAQFVRGTDDADNIYNSHVKVTIDAGAGNDSVTNNGSGWADNGIFSSTRTAHYASINGGNGNDSITNAANDSTLLGGDGDDTILNWGGYNIFSVYDHVGRNVLIDGGKGDDSIGSYGTTNVTINGGSGKDTIESSSSASSINGGKGNDLINAVEGIHVTILGGKGNDNISLGSDASNAVIKYASGDGNDKINGFNATSTLRIGDGKGTYSTVMSGDDIIVTVGKGKISLIGAANLDELHIDGATVLKVTNSTKSPVVADADVKFIDASKRSADIQITANKLANSIVGGTKSDSIYGGYGADTISGGKGNDSLVGDAGKDTFIYSTGDGKDVIYGFENNDLLKITGTFSGTYDSSKNEVYFKIGNISKSITLKDFTATSFNVNGSSYKISGTKLVKQ